METEKSLSTELTNKMTKVAAFLTFGKGVSLILNLVTFVIIARIIGPSNFGIYTLIMTVVGLLTGFGNPSINSYISERIPKLISGKKNNEAKLLLGDTILLSIIFGGLLLLIGLALSGYVSIYVVHSAPNLLAIQISMLVIIFSLLYTNLYSYILSMNNGKVLAKTSILHAIAQFIFSIGLVLLGFSILGAISGYLIALVISTIFEFSVLYKTSGINIKLENFKKRAINILSFSKSLAYSNIASNISGNFGVLFLGILVPASLVGYYGVASKIGALIDVFVGAIGLAILPMFSEAIYLKKKGVNAGKFFSYSVYMAILFAMPIIMFLVVFAGEITFIAFSNTYAGSVPYMQLISIGILISLFSGFGSNFLISSAKQKKIFKYTLITSIIQIITTIILVPLFNVYGLILSLFFIGTIASNILYFNYLCKLGIDIKLRKLSRLIFSNILFAFIILPLTLIIPESIGLVLGFFAIFLLYPIILGFLKGISKTDLELIEKASKSIPLFGVVVRKIVSYANIFVRC
ncbi:MAG: oligosaccharide flippase family protein [Candidatus Micrarchaeia archaeon]